MKNITFIIRTLVKQPAYTIICVLGLAIGLGIAMVSMSYMVRELRWEDCHANHDRIYRVEMHYQHADTTWSSARVMAPLGDALAAEIPGIDQVAVFRHRRSVTLKVDDNTFSAGPMIFARPGFFDVFTASLQKGNPAIALQEPNSILITDSIARAYFPDEDPIGRTLAIDKLDFTVTGILSDLAPTTQMHCDFVASYSTLHNADDDLNAWTDTHADLTYLLLAGNADVKDVESQIGAVFAGHVPGDVAECYSFSLKPLKDIYFSTYYSGNRGELSPGGEYDVTIILVAVGLFILIQAMFNFINLSTARAADRMKEVGVRKTFGASRYSLITRFMGESMVLTFAATALGLFFYDFFRKGYTAVTPDPYELVNLYTEPGTFVLIILLATVVGVFSGYYPALYLSRFRPIAVLGHHSTSGSSRSLLRKSLTVFQFTLAIFFIVLTIGHHNQFRFITNYDLGFERENTMVLRFDGDDTGPDDCALAKSEILARNDVLGAARSNGVMGGRFQSQLFYTDPDRTELSLKLAKDFAVDFDFVSFYGLEMVEGRDFSSDRPEDIGHAILINESMKKELGLTNAVGYKLYTESKEWEVIGVVKDFHGTALDWSYRGTSVMTLDPDRCRVLCVRLRGDDIAGSVAAIGATWGRMFGDRVFNYTFLEDNIRARYAKLDSIAGLFGVLSIISLVIAGLGTFGLVLYTVQRKTKEMAIRKVLGASMASVMRILTKELVYLIFLANLIACPFAYLVMIMGLEYYPVRTSLGVGTYISGGIITLLITLTVTSFHVLKAARANPVDSLRHE